MNEKLANTLIDLGVEINTYQDGDAFIKTYQFNDAQLLAFREEAYQAGLRRADEKYKGIFNWLLGIEGDFPNLAEKPHYRFRTELRERLAALDAEITKVSE